MEELPEPAPTSEMTEKGGRPVDGYADDPLAHDDGPLGCFGIMVALVLVAVPLLYGLIIGTWLWL